MNVPAPQQRYVGTTFPEGTKLGEVRCIGIETELSVKKRYRAKKEKHNDYTLSAFTRKRLEKSKVFLEDKYDCQCREFNTAPISLAAINQKKHRKYLEQYFGILNQISIPKSQGGTHIHISILKSDNDKLLANVIWLQKKFGEQIKQIAGRDSSWAQTPDDIETYTRAEYAAQSASRRYWLITPNKGGRTLEMRAAKGSNDINEVLAWKDLLENIHKVCNQDDISKVKFSDVIKGRWLPKYVKNMDRPLTKQQLNQKIGAY